MRGNGANIDKHTVRNVLRRPRRFFLTWRESLLPLSVWLCCFRPAILRLSNYTSISQQYGIWIHWEICTTPTAHLVHINSLIIAATPDVKIFHTHCNWTKALTLFRLYSSMARKAESVSFTKISSLLSFAFKLLSPYEVPVHSAAIFANCCSAVCRPPNCIPLWLSSLLFFFLFQRYYYSLDIAMHFTWYLVAIAGWWDADDDNNYRDSLFSLSHCMCALIMKILHKITSAHLVWNFLHNLFHLQQQLPGCRIPIRNPLYSSHSGDTHTI